MNKFLKAIIAILGSFNVVFSIFVPIALVMLLINNYTFTNFQAQFLLIVGLFATLYRGLKYTIDL